jgi:hypothetical protein
MLVVRQVIARLRSSSQDISNIEFSGFADFSREYLSHKRHACAIQKVLKLTFLAFMFETEKIAGSLR